MVQPRLDVPNCPGFCGRIQENTTFGWSECGPCPWGTRTRAVQCVECQHSISSYDWCYLLFMAIVPLLINCFYVHLKVPKKQLVSDWIPQARYLDQPGIIASRIAESLQILCCFCECICSIFITLLIFPPRGSLALYGCHKSGIRDWYSALYNPVIGYVKQIKCSYEIVFPLYSLPFFYFLFLLIFMLIFRSLLYSYVVREHDPRSFYYGLLALPKVAVVHGLLAGVIYLTFPYLLILFSIGSNAFHLALEGKAPIREIIRRIYRSPLQLILLVVNMVLLAFAITALTVASTSNYGYFFMFLVPVPALFYIATIGLSHPSVLNDV